MLVVPYGQKDLYLPNVIQDNEKDRNTISSATINAFTSCNNLALKKELKKYYFKIKDFFSPIERNKILERIKYMTPNSEISEESHDMLISTLPEMLKFSSNYEMERPNKIFSDYLSLGSIQDVYIISINRFAKILGLIGQHKITFKLIRLHNRNGKVFDGSWHYDIKTSKTLVIMLKNDFHYLSSKGLDIAFNGIQGPHDPNKSVKTFPENNQYISAKYDDAIMLNNDIGNIVHRTPPLGFEPQQRTPERVFIQIKL